MQFFLKECFHSFIEEPAARRAIKLFDPLSSSVVGQAISYVVIYKDVYKSLVPFFATANPKRIAVFRTPENIMEYVDLDKAEAGEYECAIKPGKYAELIKKHLILSEELKLDEAYIQELLDKLAKDYLKAKVLKIEPTWALIDYFRSFINDLSDSCKELLELKLKEDQKLKSELEKLEKETGHKLDTKSLVRIMAYVLMDKLIFYKVLEEKFKLPRMIAIDTSSSTKFIEQLNFYFDKAIEVTEDFEPVFITGLYDLLPIPDDPEVMDYIKPRLSMISIG